VHHDDDSGVDHDHGCIHYDEASARHNHGPDAT
jgi:hypothetical protein